MGLLILALGVVAFVGFSLIGGAIYHGLVLKLLWGWFMVPIFGLPSLSIVEAIGVSLVVGFLTKVYVPIPEEKETECKIAMLITPAVALLVGWVLHLFM